MDLKELREKFVAKLALSGLSLIDAKNMHLVTHEAGEVEGMGLPAVAAGFKIPYFTIAGNKSSFFRFRYLEDTRKGFERMTGKKPLRYGQVANTLNEIYFPPCIGWKKWIAKKEPLIITEGELKAACASKMGIPTIGLGGVWCFMSKKNNIALLPDFDELDLDKRETFICYDSDAASNPEVVMAEAVLAKRLLERGAVVRLVRLPNVLESGKTGLDDFLVKNGVDKFIKLLGEAEEYETSKELHALNSEVVYVRNPGLIYSYEHSLEMRTTDFISHAYSNRWHYEKVVTQKGEKLERKRTANEWMSWPQRAELKSITYAPGFPKITDDYMLNKWNGWPLEPKKGSIAPWRLLLDHVFFGEHASVRKWFEQWAAYPIQMPGAKMHSAVLIWGVIEGSGKTTVGQTLMMLYGENGAELKDSDLEDARNEWAENKQFVLGDDITGQDNRKHANRIKTMITQKHVRLNKKYIPSYSIPDCINYFFTSNDPNALFLDDGNRRNFIHEVRNEKLTEKFREQFFSWRDKEEGLAALFYHLLHVDLTGFDAKADAMYTSSKSEMTRISKSDMGEWVAKLREDPERVLGDKLKGDLFTSDELYAVFDPAGEKRGSPNALSRELKRAFFRLAGNSGDPLRTKTGYKRAYAVRNKDKWILETSRKEAVDHYDMHHPEVPQSKSKY